MAAKKTTKRERARKGQEPAPPALTSALRSAKERDPAQRVREQITALRAAGEEGPEIDADWRNGLSARWRAATEPPPAKAEVSGAVASATTLVTLAIRAGMPRKQAMALVENLPSAPGFVPTLTPSESALRAARRASELATDLHAIAILLPDMAQDADLVAAVERITTMVDRLYETFLPLKLDPADPDKEFRQRFIDACERSTSPDEVREVLRARGMPEERVTDDEIARAVAACKRRGRQPGAKRWPTLAAILFKTVGSARSFAGELEEERRTWVNPARREKKRLRDKRRPKRQKAKRKPKKERR